MNSEVERLVPEQLRAIRAKVDKIDGEVGDVRQRVSSMEHHMAAMQRLLANQQGDVVNVHPRLDRQGEQLERIERRLALSDAPA